MRKLSLLSLGVAFTLAGASASAGPLTSASLTFSIGPLPPATLVASGATGTATSSLSATLDAGTPFAGSVTTTIPTAASPPLTQLQLELAGNEAGSFTGTAPGAVGGSAAFSSVVTFKAFAGFTLLSVPLKIGTPNTFTATADLINVTTIGASWTAGTAAITGITTGPYSVTAMGSNGLNASGVGTLKLVSPVKIVTSIAPPLAGFAVLSLTYVPEPGTLGLLGAGVLALVALGRRRL